MSKACKYSLVTLYVFHVRMIFFYHILLETWKISLSYVLIMLHVYTRCGKHFYIVFELDIFNKFMEIKSLIFHRTSVW